MTAGLTATASLNLTNLHIPDELENQLRRADLFTRGIVTCCQNLLLEQTINKEQTGIFISTAYGPMQCNLDVLDFLVEEEPVSPTLFSHSVFNGASGYLARIFGIHGPALTQTSYSFPFFTILGQAQFELEQGNLKQAVVIQAETYSALLEDAKQVNSSPWPTGVAAWLLSSKGPELLHIKVNETPCPPQARLQYTVKSSTGKTHKHPLSMAMELSQMFTAGVLPEKYSLQSAFGNVEIQWGKSL
jgi:hypothetical protein